MVVLVAALGLLVARLASGPVSLTWALPLIEGFLADRTGPIEATAGTLSLDWRDWNAPVLDVGDVTAAGPTFRLTIRTLRAAGGLSGPPRWGELSLRRLWARDVHLTLPLPDQASTGSLSEGGLAGLLAPQEGPLARLEAIDVSNVGLTLARPGGEAAWQGHIDTAAIVRGSAGLEGRADLTFDQAGVPAKATLNVTADAATGATAGHLDFAGIRPAALAPLDPALAPIGALDLPLSGSVTVALDRQLNPGPFKVSATGGSGALVLSSEWASRIDPQMAAQSLPVLDLSVQASGDPSEESWAVDNLALTLSDDAVLRLPPPLSVALPLRHLEAAGHIAGQTVTVERAAAAVAGGMRLEASGTIEEAFARPHGPVAATLHQATLADVRRYWPKGLATDTYEWIDKHIVAGTLGDVRMTARIGDEDGQPAVSALSLTIPLEGAVVDYLPPLPPLRNASAIVNVSLDTLNVTVSRATIGDLVLSDGRVTIPDLNKDVPSLEIDARANGPASAVVDLLATPPFEVLAGTGITGNQAGGMVIARVRLAFPLLDDIKLEQMDLNVSAQTNGLALHNVYNDLSLTDANLRVEVTENGLKAQGPLRFAGVDGVIDWDEDFLPATPLRTDLIFTVVRASVPEVRRALAPWADTGRWLKGGHFAGEVRYTARDDGTANLDGRLDLGAAELALPELHWSKPAGRTALAEAQAFILGDRLEAINNVALSAADADIRGHALFGDDGRLDSLDLEHFRLGRNQVSGHMHALDHRGWSVDLHGATLDLEPFLADQGKPGETATEPDAAAPVPDLVVSADLTTVWLGTDQPLRQVVVTAVRTDAVWQNVQVAAETDNGAPITLEMVPAPDGTSRLTLSASDAGATLAGLGIMPTMVGGVLEGNAALVPQPDGSPRLSGVVKIRNFRLVRAPLLARALDLLALSGLRDLLTGRGMPFWGLRIPFQEADGIVELNDVRVAGPAVGLTGSGVINLADNTVDMQGTIIPFYWANNLIRSIPLLGPLLTGGTEGLFAASYRVTGSLKDPTVNVNPYAMILPSLVRELLAWVQSLVTPPTSRPIGP
ncbi:MAG: AsmA-like C-terminal domain-containing protein [Rhodospirillales bacterium]